MLAADRGDAHDVALLPPFSTWPTVANRSTPTNIESRHDGKAAVLYADGHAEAQGGGNQWQEIMAWGGGWVRHAAMDRLHARHPVFQTLVSTLVRDDRSRALVILRERPREARAATAAFLPLWELSVRGKLALSENADSPGTPIEQSAAVPSDKTDWLPDRGDERFGWKLATLWQAAGDPGVLQELNAVQSRLSREQAALVSRHPWETYRSEWGFGVEYPQVWTAGTETPGRYRNTFLRSRATHVWLLVENGIRSSPGVDGPVDWGAWKPNSGKRTAAVINGCA
jgi:prepilin-type processing-associated H-X9-DG protein